jgi:hypothetical protein
MKAYRFSDGGYATLYCSFEKSITIEKRFSIYNQYAKWRSKSCIKNATDGLTLKQ